MSQEDADPGNPVLRAADAFNAGAGVCRVCGCTEDDPCALEDIGNGITACCWIAPDLCSACRSYGPRDDARIDVPPLLYDAYGGVLVR